MKYKSGDRITTTGKGRTATWDRTYTGTVTGADYDVVYVRWDGAAFNDEMEPEEVRRVQEETNGIH